MTSPTFLRRSAVLLAIVVLALAGIALPATAKSGPRGGHRHQETTDATSTHGHRGRSGEAKARKAARFVAVGLVTQVDTAGLQVEVKGGHRALRHADQPVTFTVDDDTRIKRNGEPVELAEIQVGDHVGVKGARATDGTLVARKLFARGPEADDTADADDTEDATEDATDDVDGTEDATDDATGSSDDTEGTADESDGADDSADDSSDGEPTP